MYLYSSNNHYTTELTLKGGIQANSKKQIFSFYLFFLLALNKYRKMKNINC